MEFEEKKQRLLRRMDEYGKKDFAVAFSGGVDSSLLLYLAVQAAGKQGNQVYALTADTVLHPSEDLEIAKKVAESAGAIHRVVYVDELKNEAILNNPMDRCYICKKQLFLEFFQVCREVGASCILEGSNGDDLSVYRPGIRAVRELQVDSPLAEVGLTKEEVRKMAAELGIPTASRPSTPCMATRLPYGARLEPELLGRIEKGEQLLKQLGFPRVRLRVHGEIVRLEVPSADLEKAVSNREKMVEGLQQMGFHYITLDLEGFRSGSMDQYLTEEQKQMGFAQP